jgi:hypothetical protein
MRKTAGLLFCLTFFAALKETRAQDSAALAQWVAKSKTTFTLVNNKPTGAGWNLVAAQFAQHSFVGWGEYHNSPQISYLTNEALQVAAASQYNVWCTEAGYHDAMDLIQIATNPRYYAQIKALNKPFGFTGYTAIPFFSLPQDSLMTQTALSHNIAIWGIDQMGQLCFPTHLTRAYNGLAPALKSKYKPLFDSIMVRWYMPKTKHLDSLLAVVSNAGDKERLAELKVSKQILLAGNSDPYLSNKTRSDLMKTHFYSQLRAFEAGGKQKAKIFFKMGDNHLAKGFNLDTRQLDMGNLAHELCAGRGGSYTNMQFIARFYKNDKDELIDELQNNETSYSRVFLNQYDKNNWVVIDLKPLRNQLRYDKTVDENTYEIIDKYDIIVLSPEIIKQ